MKSSELMGYITMTIIIVLLAVQLRSCVRVEVSVLGLTILLVSVDVKLY